MLLNEKLMHWIAKLLKLDSSWDHIIYSDFHKIDISQLMKKKKFSEQIWNIWVDICKHTRLWTVHFTGWSEWKLCFHSFCTPLYKIKTIIFELIMKTIQNLCHSNKEQIYTQFDRCFQIYIRIFFIPYTDDWVIFSTWHVNWNFWIRTYSFYFLSG